jgi:hypothetical protein
MEGYNYLMKKAVSGGKNSAGIVSMVLLLTTSQKHRAKRLTT